MLEFFLWLVENYPLNNKVMECGFTGPKKKERTQEALDLITTTIEGIKAKKKNSAKLKFLKEQLALLLAVNTKDIPLDETILSEDIEKFIFWIWMYRKLATEYWINLSEIQKFMAKMMTDETYSCFWLYYFKACRQIVRKLNAPAMPLKKVFQRMNSPAHLMEFVVSYSIPGETLLIKTRPADYFQAMLTFQGELDHLSVPVQPEERKKAFCLFKEYLRLASVIDNHRKHANRKRLS